MAQYISKWEGGDELVPYAWRSKIVTLPSKKTLTAGKVIADGYPLILQFYFNGIWRASKLVENRNAFRLPSGFEYEEFEVRITGTAKISAVYVAETMDELRPT